MKGTNGKIVFVTGGENGLGATIAKKFAKEGSQVVIFGIYAVNGEKVDSKLNSLCEDSMYIKGNVLSEACFSSVFKGFPIYIASNHAVNGLIKSAAIEYASSGISINAIAPRTMKTPLV